MKTIVVNSSQTMGDVQTELFLDDYENIQGVSLHCFSKIEDWTYEAVIVQF